MRLRAPLVPHSKGAARAVLYFPAGDAATGPMCMLFLNGTRAPTAAYCGFRSHRLRATAPERRNDMVQHRTYQWTRLICGHETHTAVTPVQGCNSRRSPCRHGSWHSKPHPTENRPAAVTPLPQGFDPKTPRAMLGWWASRMASQWPR